MNKPENIARRLVEVWDDEAKIEEAIYILPGQLSDAVERLRDEVKALRNPAVISLFQYRATCEMYQRWATTGRYYK